MHKTNRVIYRGPGRINGAPIVVVAVVSSANSKTGNMVQTYILTDADTMPLQAVRKGLDVAICGDCRHRGTYDAVSDTYRDRTCYVNLGQGARMVADGLVRGIYPDISGDADAIAALAAGRMVRLGTYGDPAAVPGEVWLALLSHAAGHTGYTHQWRTDAADALRPILMASADSEADAAEARAAGWRYFRVAMPSHAAKLAGEARCPASKEMGKRMQCSDCLACSGSGKRASIVIQAHGPSAVMAAVRRIDAMQIA